jgi:peptidoglycan/LPS O-acetylase OafA/YrhL
LDGVRGIAILAVLGFHLFGLPGGFYGVDLFFVLSGFLITTLLLEERERTGAISLHAFYARRARRLLPALVIYLPFPLIAFGAFHHPVWWSIGAVAGPALYCLNFMIAFWHVSFTLPVGHLWSLSQEEQFYAVWPALVALTFRCVRESRLLPPLIATFAALVLYRAGLAAAGAGYTRIYYGPDTHADGLVIGCAAAVARRQQIRLPAWVGFAAIGVLGAAFTAGELSVDWMVFALPIVNFAAAIVVLDAANDRMLGHVLSIRPLPWLGAISYSLYLWHEFAHWYVSGHHPIQELELTIPLALGSYYFVERPFRTGRTTAASASVPLLELAHPSAGSQANASAAARRSH